MEKTVETVIKQKEDYLLKKRFEREEREKTTLLLKMGLTYKKYDEESKGYSKEYPFCDNSLQKPRYYKNVFLPVTDEEYEKLKFLDEKIENLSPNNDYKKVKHNPYETALKVIGIIIFILGFISGILVWVQLRNSTIDLLGLEYCIITWASSFISGISFLAFGEIIGLLDRKK